MKGGLYLFIRSQFKPQWRIIFPRRLFKLPPIHPSSTCASIHLSIYSSIHPCIYSSILQWISLHAHLPFRPSTTPTRRFSCVCSEQCSSHSAQAVLFFLQHTHTHMRKHTHVHAHTYTDTECRRSGPAQLVENSGMQAIAHRGHL